MLTLSKCTNKLKWGHQINVPFSSWRPDAPLSSLSYRIYAVELKGYVTDRK